MKTGIADLPLHYGSCPRWLFGRMKNLGKSISEIIILEFGKDGYPYPVDRKTYDKSIEILSCFRKCKNRKQGKD